MAMNVLAVATSLAYSIIDRQGEGAGVAAGGEEKGWQGCSQRPCLHSSSSPTYPSPLTIPSAHSYTSAPCQPALPPLIRMLPLIDVERSYMVLPHVDGPTLSMHHTTEFGIMTQS